MLAIVLIILQLILLAYFLFFAYYNFRYSFYSLKKPVIKKCKPGNKKVAIVIVSYNEGDVLKDTISACEDLTYKNKVIICADDSNDNKTFPMLLKIAQNKGAKRLYDKKYIDQGKTEVYQSKNFALFHRHKNEGFKAGSLKELENYLKANNFKYMYLLDADWKPQPDAIERCLEVIEANKKTAFVQTKRASYHQEKENLQRCLALNEESCYYVDLVGRQNSGDVILFSGCCTLFDLKKLYKAEGFLPGHLTEDIDLTNRFYLMGYKGIYLKYVYNIGDVPHHYSAYRRQQDRWAAGTARTLKEYFWLIVKSKKMNWREKMSMIRQNSYFTTALAIEISILLAFFSVLLLTIKTDSYTATLYLYYINYFAKAYSALLLIALFSNFVPLFVTCSIKKKYKNLFFIPYATWLSWSMLHTYFAANLKGFLNIKQGWALTPKLSLKKRTAYFKEKIRQPFSLKFKLVN